MSFWGGKKKDRESDSLELRNKQVTQLLDMGQTLGLRSVDKTTFSFSIATKYGALPVNIVLPTKFPEAAPQIQVLARVTHRWVDKNMYVVGHKDLMVWSPHNNLSRIVLEISQEFSRNPPTPQATTIQVPQFATPTISPPTQSPGTLFAPTPTTGLQPPSPMSEIVGPRPVHTRTDSQNLLTGGVPLDWQGRPLQLVPPTFGASSPMTVSPTRLSVTSSTPTVTTVTTLSALSGVETKSKTKQATKPPPVDESYPFLETLSITELEDLLKSSDAVLDRVDALESVKSTTAVRDELYTGIQEQAKKNLSRESELKELQEQRDALRTQLNEKQIAYNELIARQTAVKERYSLPAVLSALTAGIEQAEIASDEIKKRFEDEDESEEKTIKEEVEDGSMEVEKDKTKKKKKMTLVGFTKEYVKARELVHMRTAKREKLQEMYGQP